MVLPYYADAKRLDQVKSAVLNSQKTTWKSQISRAVHLLHQNNIIWGDVAPDNILICENESKAVLIDSGGGFKLRWVDYNLFGSKEGDLDALKRIIDYIDIMGTTVQTF